MIPCERSDSACYCDKPPLVYSLSPNRTLLASFLFCDLPIAGDIRGSGDTAPSSTLRISSVAAERSYRVCGSAYLVRQCIPIEPSSHVLSRVPMTHPQEKKAARGCWFESPSDPCFISQKKRPFIGPTRHLIGQFGHPEVVPSSLFYIFVP